MADDDSKKNNEGEKQVAVYKVHGLESQCRHRYCVLCPSLSLWVVWGS